MPAPSPPPAARFLCAPAWKAPLLTRDIFYSRFPIKEVASHLKIYPACSPACIVRTTHPSPALAKPASDCLSPGQLSKRIKVESGWIAKSAAVPPSACFYQPGILPPRLSLPAADLGVWDEERLPGFPGFPVRLCRRPCLDLHCAGKFCPFVWGRASQPGVYHPRR